MTLRRFACLFSPILLLALPASAQANGRVASATGVKQVSGKTLYVDVVVAVPVGQTDRQATDNALSQQGCEPAREAAVGWRWRGRRRWRWRWRRAVFLHRAQMEPALRDPELQPGGAALDAKAALTNTYSDWSNLPDSAYEIAYGADTTRCPSLVQQCPGAQVNDPYNDVGWLVLGGTTLGVTWYTTGSDPEADMALNTRFVEEHLRQQRKRL